MGYNVEDLKAYTLPGGGAGETGTFSFCAGCVTQAIPTQNMKLYYWSTQVQTDSLSRNLYGDSVVTTGDISNGFINFVRTTSFSDNSITCYYQLTGY